MRFFLLLGYCGIILLALQRRNTILAFLLIGIIAGGWAKFPSHIERRYLIPNYWPFAFLTGYFLEFVFIWFSRRSAWLRLLRKVRQPEFLS